MADTQTLKYAFTGTVDEVKDLSMDLVTNPTITHTLGTDSGTLTASTTVPVTKTYSDTLPLVAGVLDIDLTSLPGPEATTITFTGLKVQFVKIICPASNTLPIAFWKHAANGYNLFGADNASAERVEVMPGGKFMMYHPNSAEDVDATHKVVTIAGDGTESFSILIVAG